ncbi:MAG TPA: hypothetical protein VEQ60_09125 [Longimicrobium sp.]|nr:hypothetical protein [Longimicrobium sp.]
MSLVSIDNPTKEVHLTGQLLRKYEWLVRQLGVELGPIEDRLNNMIDGDRIHTSSWMPGADWTGTPFQAIWEVNGRDVEEAAKAFGLIVWKVFERRPERWASAHGMKDGKEIKGRTYFQVS